MRNKNGDAPSKFLKEKHTCQIDDNIIKNL